MTAERFIEFSLLVFTEFAADALSGRRRREAEILLLSIPSRRSPVPLVVAGFCRKGPEENGMPNVMIRENEGVMTLYVPKRDLEDTITSIEFDSEDAWGGELTLGDGSSFIIDKMPGKPDLPITVRARRGAGE